MYLWKYWRESRIVFGAGLVLIAGLFAAVLHGHQFVFTGNSNSDAARQVTGLVVVFFYLQILPLGFFAWLLGSFGIGRDMGEGAGSFIFSRPRRRAYFLWADWIFGFMQVAVFVILGNVAIGLLIHRLLLAMGAPEGGSVLLLGASGRLPLLPAMLLSATGGMLIAGLIFSVTYSSTVVVRHARGVILSLGLFVGYLVLGAIVHHYWEAIRFPSLVLQAFNARGVNESVGWEIAARSVLILLFPVAAQISLDRRDL
jgi:hypothetical protein